VTANDEVVDAWPPDFNDDTRTNSSDLVILGATTTKVRRTLPTTCDMT
jgi:hypothetical protein